jgi:glycosyltransferase involved in cell wall biosynthesis
VRRVLLAFEPPDGGVAENVAQLALGLGEHGFEPHVAGPGEAVTRGRLEDEGVPFHPVPFRRGLGNPSAEARALRALGRLLDGGGFELVHAHSSKAGVLARLAARRRGLPAVYSPHCLPFVGAVSAARRVLSTVAERRLGARTDAIVCVCEDERRRALAARLAPPERLHRVYNGVDACPAGAEPDEHLARLRERGPLVGAVTVLRRQKRVDLLLDAVPRILADVPEATIVVVGEGPERERLLRHAAALGLERERRFSFLPFTAPSWRYLTALDVFVLPSQWEALPIGLLEALACGVPQVATDVGGNGEAVADGRTGRIVPFDSGELGAAVVELLRDEPLRRRLAAASRERRDELFTVERMVAETAGVYAAVVSA